ncbi:beta strand repeat-containing protein, partial [Desulfovibrio sp. SGI.102]|uniref:beta strand repeat-containing protein n=1 Tax=Desulfovibrio sp. SGI.102 TaxID=3420559 RepID=UPI003D03C1F0
MGGGSQEWSGDADHLMGGWLVNTPETAEKAQGDITLTVKRGKISEIIGGSYARNLAAAENVKLLTVTHGNITTTISGDETTSAEFVVGGSKVAGGAGANLKTGNISLTINGGTFGKEGKTKDYELVMGGNYLKASTGDVSVNNTATAENITVNISGGKFDTSVTGGSVAHVYGSGGKEQKLSVTDASTSVTITGGTFEHSSSSALVGAIELDPSIIGGGLALVADNQGTATSAITGNTLVTIAQAEGKGLIIKDKVLGGSLAQGKGATVTVGTKGQNNTSGIVVKNVSKVGDLVGGNMAEGGTATLYGDSYVEVEAGTVEAGTVEGDVIGGSYARGAGTVTTNGNTSVVFSAANSATMPQAEYIVGGDKVLGNGKATGTITGTSSVTVNNKASVTTGAVVGGSVSRATPSATEDAATATATVANSKVTINDGTSIAGVVGGGLAEYLNDKGSATSTVEDTSTVYVNGGTVTNIVYTTSPSTKASSSAAVAGAGFATGEKATASVKDSVVVIDGDKTAIQGNKDKDNAKVVAGGVAVNGGTVNVTKTSLTMKNGTVTGDLVGGNLIDGTGNAGGDITSTSVALTGGTLDGEVMGGSYVRGSSTTSKIDTTNVLVSGGTLQSADKKAQYVLGGGKALVYADGQEASLTIDTTNVTISDSVKVLGGGVIGGSLAKGTGTGKATVSVTNANTKILGGTQIAGVVGGGVAENYNTATGDVSSTVTESQLTINGGTINALRYGAQFAEEAKGDAAVVGGGVASAKGSSGKVTSNVITANTTINGGTINGNVFAGGLADGSNAEAKVTTANLTISGNADIKGNIHAGGYALNNGTATVEKATVTFDGNSSFAGTVFGQGHDATNTGKATVNNSTLAFTNYDGAFNGQVVRFDQLNVAEGSTLQLGTLSTGTLSTGTAGDEAGVFNNNALTLTGGGVVSAAEVVADKGLTVDSLATLTSSNIEVTGTGVVTVEGTLNATGTVATDDKTDINVAKGGILNVTTDTALGTGFAGADLANGGTVNLTGTTDGELTVTNLQGKFGNQGVINAGDNTVADMFKPGAAISSGMVSIDDINNSNIATNETKTLVVTGVKSSDTLNGAWKGVELAEGGSLTVNTGTLQLTGDTADFAVVDGGVNFANSDSTLMLGDTGTANSGLIKDDVTFSNGASNMTLLVTGNQDAAFVVDGDINGHSGTKGQLLAQGGATLTANGNITAGTITADGSTIQAAGADPAVAAGDIEATNITAQNGGVVAAAGSVTATNVKLDNGGLQAEKDITLSGAVTDANGALVAKTGKIDASGHDLTQSDDGQLSLVAQQGTITAKDIDATNVAAKKLTAERVSVEGGSLLLTDASTVKSLTLTKAGISVADLTVSNDVTMTDGSAGMIDKLAAEGNVTIGKTDSDGVSLVVKEMTTKPGTTMTFDPDWGYASNNAATEKQNYDPATDSNAVNNALQVGRNSYVALGTTDKGWLPSVVQGGLREDGVETVLGLAKPLVVQSTGSIELNSDAGYDSVTWTGTANSATFADNSLLVVDGNAIFGDKAAIKFADATGSTLTVSEGAKLLVTDAVAGQTYTIVGNVATSTVAGWKNNGMTSTTDMISLGDAKFDSTGKKVTTAAVRNDAHTVFPNLSDGMANAVNDLYTGHAGAAASDPNWDYADVNSADMGVRFLSRATDNRFLGMDKEAAAATIESAARIAFAGA